IPGLVLMQQALSHEQQMRLVTGLVEGHYFESTNQVMIFGQLPSFLEWISPWIQCHPSLFPSSIMSRQPLFDQLIINLYKRGQGIKDHVDLLSINCLNRFDDGIMIISLLSSCVMRLTRNEDHINLLLRPGDVLTLSGEARYLWKHGIEEREVDVFEDQLIQRGTRVSITLRKM
ncbi:hypothetical protein BDB01DRAFT_693990, partial [Pilobolus umbonatus]